MKEKSKTRRATEILAAMFTNKKENSPYPLMQGSEKSTDPLSSPIVAEFCGQNRKFWDEWRGLDWKCEGESVVVVELTGNVSIALATAFVGAAVAAHKRANLLFLSSKTGGTAARWHPLLASFGNAQFTSTKALVKDSEGEFENEVLATYESLKMPEDVLEIEHDGLLIGDIIYDSAIRQKPWQASLWKVDERVLKELRFILRSVRSVDAMRLRWNICGAVFSRPNNSFGGAIARMFVHRGVELFHGVGRIKKHRSLTTRKLSYPHRPSRSLVELALREHEKELTKASEEFFDHVFKGGIAPGPLASRETRTFENYEAFCVEFGVDSTRPSVFVMLHALNDFPHLFERSPFQDYYHWFTATLDAARNIDSVNWIFKQHPGISFYPDDADVSGKVKACNEKHIHYLDETVTIERSSLARLAHVIVTTLGTSGMEYSACGIPAITVGDSHYSGFGFCHECHDQQAYYQKLRNAHSLPRNTPQQRNMAKIILYLTNADRNKSVLGLFPRWEHAILQQQGVTDVVSEIIQRQDSPEHRRWLAALQRFIESPDATFFLDPNHFPWSESPKATIGEKRPIA